MKRKLIAFVILATSSCGYAATKDVTMNLVDSDGKERNIGKITIQKTPYGLLFT
ncbi:TPA: superoxide dismutase, partial [Escherichia coli]|nr:superoxide dismutase [Escherichia coli]HBC1147763.1 superoxide dismutase [Escherichia coli]HBC1147777.1 superoxide dismutase [Escherichia coli]HEH9961479.1 superoxide dismutase [Escherichia coli]HEH9961501.1 superoxide dismutase [Escherichia coli]